MNTIEKLSIIAHPVRMAILSSMKRHGEPLQPKQIVERTFAHFELYGNTLGYFTFENIQAQFATLQKKGAIVRAQKVGIYYEVSDMFFEDLIADLMMLTPEACSFEYIEKVSTKKEFVGELPVRIGQP